MSCLYAGPDAADAARRALHARSSRRRELLVLRHADACVPGDRLAQMRTGDVAVARRAAVAGDAESLPVFMTFLRNETETISGLLCRYEDSQWTASTAIKMKWPKTGMLLP